MQQNTKPTIIIFCSGNGSNAKAIIAHCKKQKTFEVAAIFCNNKNAGIIAWAAENNIPIHVFTKSEFLLEQSFLEIITKYNACLLVLAGFLLQVPAYLINAYPNKIINIHPALLPKYGGKGMYGHYVHEAVHANQEKESGISIHLVNEHYDEGKILKQASVAINANDNPTTIALKVLMLEHTWYPLIVEEQAILNCKKQAN